MQTIEQLQLKIARIDERLECWYQKPQTEKRIAKIERQIARRDRLYGQIDLIEARAAQEEERSQPLIDEVTGAELPRDSFDFRLERTDWGVTVNVDIYDSPFDDTFTGGEPLLLRTSATGRYTGKGFSSWHRTGTLANGQYWEGLANQTLVSGSSAFLDWEEYPNLTVMLIKDTPDRKVEDELASASYLTADIFS